MIQQLTLTLILILLLSYIQATLIDDDIYLSDVSLSSSPKHKNNTTSFNATQSLEELDGFIIDLESEKESRFHRIPPTSKTKLQFKQNFILELANHSLSDYLIDLSKASPIPELDYKTISFIMASFFRNAYAIHITSKISTQRILNELELLATPQVDRVVSQLLESLVILVKAEEEAIKRKYYFTLFIIKKTQKYKKVIKLAKSNASIVYNKAKCKLPKAETLKKVAIHLKTGIDYLNTLRIIIEYIY